MDSRTCRQITMAEFLALLQAQGVPPEHYAFKCVKCGHIQSAASLVRYRPAADAGNLAYYLCEGRFNATVGCNWTLGGLFPIHKLEVLTDEGLVVPVFEPATPEEAQALMAKTAGNIRHCRVCGCNDFHACPQGCFWVEHDLCSACQDQEWPHA